MGKKNKSTSQQTTQASTRHVDTYGDTAAARAGVNNIDLTTPIKGAYGQMANQVENQYFEDDLPEAAKGRVKLGGLFNLKQSEAAALAGATAQQEQIKQGARMNLAGLTGGSDSAGSASGRNVSWTYDPLGQAMQIGQGVGAM
jgi:hypothetical protein